MDIREFTEATFGKPCADEAYSEPIYIDDGEMDETIAAIYED